MNVLWDQLAERAKLTLSAAQHALMDRYLDLLFEANQRMNLTRLTDRPTAELLHIADALTLLPFLPAGAHRMADVGTGGGVPGIPVAIARPDATVVLIESTRKKAAFLRDAIAKLELPNVAVIDERAEDAGRGQLRQTFDVVAARAVATMDFLVEWCLPLAGKGGRMLAMKGPKVQEELPHAARAIRLLGGGPAVVHPVDLPGTTGHVIVEIAKVHPTDAKYPRPATQAKGKPL